jgi:hypothetical protein
MSSADIKDTPPSQPFPGQLWFDSSSPQLYVWYSDPNSSQWVIATANAGGLSADAPVDGVTYGRKSGAWTSVLPISGGTVTGDVHFTKTTDADLGMFAGVANLAQRNAAVDGSSGITTWVGHEMLYYDLCSLASFYTQPGSQSLGVTAAVRTSDAAPLPGTSGRSPAIAFAAYAKADADVALPNSGSAFCYYGSARKLPNSLPVFLAELSMGNLDSTQPDINPWQPFPAGASLGIWMSSGSEAFAAHQTVYPGGVALAIGSNGSTWAKGIVFMHDGLAPASGTGNMKAMQLPTKAEIQWTFDATGVRSAFIRSDATAAGGCGIEFGNNSFNVVNASTEAGLFQVRNDGFVTVSGGLQAAGIADTSNITFYGSASSGTDLSSHIKLESSGQYGINYYAGQLGLSVGAGGSFNFNVGGTGIGFIGGNGINYIPIGQTGAAAGNFTSVSVNATQVAGPRITGWGTPTGPSRISNFPGASATLVQCSNAIAQIIADLKTHGMLGA